MTSTWISAVAVLALCAACSGEVEGHISGGDCTSSYEPVASAPTFSGLRAAMLAYSERGHVAALRTQARGVDVGAGDQDAVRVMDLLNRRGKRIVQVDVWRTEDGGWRAGVWNQCID